MWKKIDGRRLTVAQFEAAMPLIKFGAWRPSFGVLHNTGAPNLSQWDDTKEAQRIKNLENYFGVERKWSAGPHVFISDISICLFTPLNTPGVHSPSWNGVSFGVEMVGDYDRDVITSGRGKAVYENTVAFFSIVYSALGLAPDTIRLHKEDKLTTHACPGKNIVKANFIAAVKSYMTLNGDHDLNRGK